MGADWYCHIFLLEPKPPAMAQVQMEDMPPSHPPGEAGDLSEGQDEKSWDAERQ